MFYSVFSEHEVSQPLHITQPLKPNLISPAHYKFLEFDIHDQRPQNSAPGIFEFSENFEKFQSLGVLTGVKVSSLG